MSLIPAVAPGKPVSYWCTWATQNYGRPFLSLPDPADPVRIDGARAARNSLDETILFGADGWAHDWPDDVRRDMCLMLDDGWDVPLGVHPDAAIWCFGELAPDPGRFPSLSGGPAERLAGLVRLSRAAGWGGLGLWVACQAPGDGKDGAYLPAAALEAAWRERLRWSHAAGVAYWKVDWGRRSGDHQARALLTHLARSEAPGLLIEHARCCPPLNAASGDGRIADDPALAKDFASPLAYSDIVRAYDVLEQLSTSTMLDRVAFLLRNHGDGDALINAEDEAYLAAGLACTMGVMRSERWSIPCCLDRDLDPTDRRRRCSESVRALRWQRLAPPLPANALALSVSEQSLDESWDFRPGETWLQEVVGKTIVQGAPAVIARGCPLPEVVSAGLTPFVVATRHPDGAQAVAVLPRTRPRRPAQTGAATITMPAPARFQAVFGHLERLELITPRARTIRVRGQDLAGGAVADLDRRVVRRDDRLVFDGELLTALGTGAEPAGGRSQPGCIIELG